MIIGAGLGYLFFLRPNQPEPPLVNDEPDGDTEIVFTTTDGDEFTIDGLLAEEKPLVIYFFATWCPICRKDLENLNATYPQYEEEISVLWWASTPRSPWTRSGTTRRAELPVALRSLQQGCDNGVQDRLPSLEGGDLTG